MIKKIVLWICALAILSWQSYRYWPVTVHIRDPDPKKEFSIRMPLKDKKHLEFFFREVCFLNVWAYTLLGSKPSSVDQYKKQRPAWRDAVKNPDFFDILRLCFWPPHFQRIHYLFTPHQLKIKWGWETLNKYIHHFPDSRFLLRSCCTDDNEMVVLEIIDKVKVMSTVKQHLADFQDTLKNRGIELEELMDNEKLLYFMKGLNHEGFSGTLLGYGRDNAWLYYKSQNQDLADWPMVSAWEVEELENLDQLNRRTQAFEPWDLSDLFYPRFACNPNSEETKQLKQIYREERKKIIDHFQGKDIVEAGLSLFNRE